MTDLLTPYHPGDRVTFKTSFGETVEAVILCLRTDRGERMALLSCRGPGVTRKVWVDIKFIQLRQSEK